MGAVRQGQDCEAQDVRLAARARPESEGVEQWSSGIGKGGVSFSAALSRVHLGLV